MGEILGIGMTHFPLMLYQGDLGYVLQGSLAVVWGGTDIVSSGGHPRDYAAADH